MSTDQTNFPMNGSLNHSKDEDFDLRHNFGTFTPMERENCAVKKQILYQKKTFFVSPTTFNYNNHSHKSNTATETSMNGIFKNGTSPKNGTNSGIYEKNNYSTLLHGAFSTPLTTSPSKFTKRPPPSSSNWEPSFVKNEQNDFEANDSSLPSHANRQNSIFASPPAKRMFYRRSQNSSSAFWGSPSTSNDANSSLDSDDPFAFKPVPVMFMFDYSPIAPFFTSAYCFSNHFRCASLIIDGQRFVCTEQYYMFYKARVFGDKRAMRQIMATEEPKIMKKIGANVEGFDQEKWYKIAIQVMVIASVKKFEQNPELRRQLFETSGADLIEVNPTDQRWSIGLGMNDWRVREKQMWKGLNWMGRLLTMLRDKLLERPEFHAEKQQLLGEISTSFDAADSVGCLQRIGGPKKEEEEEEEEAASSPAAE
ncbi:hypothetical protein niasHS_013448 [Heterodera schachtii]|uniref:NADAR domain-containing protein n=1 Tax=Heterodera schachtii TaxID=97005 RepID=A0ABD2ICQ7_HETSC